MMCLFQSGGGEATKAEEVKGHYTESRQDVVYADRRSAILPRTETDPESAGHETG